MKTMYMTLETVYKELGLSPRNTIIWSSDPNLPTCTEKGIKGMTNHFFDQETKKLYTYRIKNYKK